MHEVIVIGGGPAGLAATQDLLGKHRDVLLIAEHLSGQAGMHQQLDDDNEEYITGEDIVALLARRLTLQRDVVLRDRVSTITKTNGIFHVDTPHGGAQTAGTVIFSTGVTPTPLDVPGAAQLVGYGIGYSASTHAHILENKRVAVVGTTARALRGVHELAQTAAQVYLVAPQSGQLTSLLGMALPYRTNVDVLEGYQPVEVVGTTTVEEFIVARDGSKQSLAVDAIFVDLGLRPNSLLLRNLAKMDRDGFVQVDARFATSVTGLFAAGDVTTTLSEGILMAIGDGARAAHSAHDYLLAHPSLQRRDRA